MLRIAHISDLHIKHDDIKTEERSALQWLAGSLAGGSGFSVEAAGHSPEKVVALANVFKSLSPDVIVLTGDITNFGDAKSFELASGYIKTLQEAAGAGSVFCVPGNHDALCERANEVRKRTLGRLTLWAVSKVDRTTQVTATVEAPARWGRLKRAASWAVSKFVRTPAIEAKDAGRFGPAMRKAMEGGDAPALLSNFTDWARGQKFHAVDPGRPLYVHADWGHVAFFLFNSTNDPGVMANEGRIGDKQFNALNVCLQDSESREACDRAVRLALLHHHPISAPKSRDKSYNRFYDWMQDGPLFLQYMNKSGFHLVLHGHQHEPFQCTVNYAATPGSGLHIVAAGSATQGTDHEHNSFNVIDLLTPFQARVRQFDYSLTGFAPSKEVDVTLPLRPIEEVRVTDEKEEKEATVEDWAMRGLVGGGFAGAHELDSQHRYEELSFDVVVTESQRYVAEYRRAGRAVGDEPSEGPVFVISGSPAMKTEHMDLGAVDNLTRKPVTCHVVDETDNRKVIRVRPRKELRDGDAFDVTLKFQWQATESEPNHFDGMNLMYFSPADGRPKRGEVVDPGQDADVASSYVAERLRYTAWLPWEPAQARVRAYGVKTFAPDLKEGSGVTPVADEERLAEPLRLKGVTHRYSFEIERPQPLAYLIRFGPK